MTTAAQLVDRLRMRLAAVEDDVLLPDTTLLACVNDGLIALAEERDWPWLETRATIAVVSGTSEYALPADLTRIHNVFIGGRKITSVLYEELERNTTRQPGPAVEFAEVGQQLILSPVPNANAEIRIHYQRFEDELVADGDTPLLPSRYASLAVSFAAVYAAIITRDHAFLQDVMKLKDDELKRSLNSLNQSTVGPRIITRNDNRG